MIANLLPEYYKVHGNDPVYKVLKSTVIDAHEIAWMEFRGMSGKRKYSGRLLYCECNFTKGIGWDVKDSKDGRPYNLLGPEKCPKRKEVVRLRHLELQKEYLKRFGAGNNLLILRQRIPEIVSDLMKKVRAGEFLEDGNGASFWGGYFYLQTLAAIVDPSMNIWEVGDLLVKTKEISLEGAVVQDYREPPPPQWEPYLDVKLGNWFGIASLPQHRQMPKVWRLAVTNPNGRIVSVENLALNFDPVFGPDVSDVENAKRKLLKLIRKAMRKRKK